MSGSSRILILSQHFPPEVIGGVETRFEAMAIAAAKLGNQVTVVVTDGSSRSEQRATNLDISRMAWNVDLVTKPKPLKAHFAQRLCELPTPTVVWTANPRFVLSVKNLLPAVPVVFMPGQVQPLNLHSRICRLWRSYRDFGGQYALRCERRDQIFLSAIQHCDVLAVPCSHQREAVATGARWIAQKTRVLARGVCLDRWRGCRRQRSIAGSETLRLLIACRLDAGKNIDLAIHALHIAARSGTSVQLRIVGSGPEESNLRQLVGELSLTGHVELMPMTKDLRPHYHWADCFVMCSRNELFGNTVLEALAAGCPVFLRENAPPQIVIGVWEQLRDCPAIVPFASFGENGLAEAITDLCREPTRLATLAACAEVWSERFDWQRFIGSYLMDITHVAD